MRLSSYLASKQPVLHTVFSNALRNDRVSHAYLLIGEVGTPLKEIAIYLAKSLVCDHPSPLADESCITCQRIDAEEFTDLIVLDGSVSSIKKDEVGDVVESFEKTPLEAKGKMIYIVNMVENMTVEAINSILKFLEEPKEGTYAILTTQNEAKVLPTIVSRCQSIRLKQTPRRDVIDEATGNGASLKDAEILSYFYNDASLVKDASDTEEYQNAMAAFEKQLNGLTQGKLAAKYVIEKDVSALLSGKQSARYFFEMLAMAFQDIVFKKQGYPITLTSYDKIIDRLANCFESPEKALFGIMSMRGEIESNISMNLILPHLINLIYKE